MTFITYVGTEYENVLEAALQVRSLAYHVVLGAPKHMES